MAIRRRLVTSLCILGGAAIFAPVSALAGDAPVPTGLPVITGDAIVGQTLTTSNGAWSSEGSLAYYYQWQRCGLIECVNIPGATASSYALTAPDLGAAIDVWVTADVVEGPPGLAAATGINATVSPIVQSAGSPLIRINAKRSHKLYKLTSSGTKAGSGRIALYFWEKNGKVVSRKATCLVALKPGEAVTLSVVNSLGQEATSNYTLKP